MMILRFSLFFILFSIVFSTYGEEKKEKERKTHHMVQLSRFYRSGEYLLYDCNNRHFVCVDKTSFDECREKRNEAIDKRNFLLPCAPLKKLGHFEICVEVQYSKIYQMGNRDFCFSKGSILRE